MLQQITKYISISGYCPWRAPAPFNLKKCFQFFYRFLFQELKNTTFLTVILVYHYILLDSIELYLLEPSLVSSALRERFRNTCFKIRTNR